MKKKLFILFLLLSVSAFAYWAYQQRGYKEGDILFQVSKSHQSPLIQKATGSKWSHCGVVVEKNKKMYVLEASKVVKLTPLQEWIKRGKDGKVKKMRVKREPVKIKYKKYLGKPYDLAFKFDNGKWYCSELIYDIYKTQLGIELCQPRKIREYHIDGMEDVLKKRGMNPDQMVVAPCDLLNY
ncbi:MAG: hypothetical protein J5554_05185 [Paludibacteraceae bacterium]|nr:hypothetical protein [Paludibacteraceae bacterium]MBR4815220.1 hypothetical protein [Paludibacteraceae bacterium]